jgi:hypothetical protein
VTGKARIETLQKRAAMLSMRLQGYSLQQIGEAQDPPMSMQAVHQHIKAALENTLPEVVEEARTLEVLRLDELLTGVYEKGINGDIPALDRVLAIQVRRARLLALDQAQGGGIRFGADGPTEDASDGVHVIRVEVVGNPEATRASQPPERQHVNRANGNGADHGDV